MDSPSTLAFVRQHASTAALLLGCYVGLVVLYRLTLHPLARYPGPFISKVSGLSALAQVCTANRHLISLREHQKYGPVVRIGPNALSFSTPTALRQIYQSSKESNLLRKSSFYETLDAPAGALSVHTEISRSKHAARRRVLDHAFSASAVHSNEPYIIDNVEILCRVLAPGASQDWSPARDAGKFMTWFAYDVMGALIFGRQFDCLTDAAHRFVPELIISSSYFLYKVAYLPCQNIVRPIISSPFLMKYLGGQSARDEHAYVHYSNQRIQERIAQEDNVDHEKNREYGRTRRDTAHYLLNARDPITGKGYTIDELTADSTLLIAAGSDTTSTTIAALFFYLTLPSNMPVLEHLQNQIRTAFEQDTDMTGSACVSLRYLRACIDEALRLAPAVPSYVPRTVVARSGVDIGGNIIPAGITVGASAYVIHHDESVFPDPWRFDPDRWLVDEAKPSSSKVEQVKKARQAFIPFSLGSRGCVGKELAYREMTICVARLLHRFDIRRARNAVGEIQRSKMFGRLRGGLAVRHDEFQLYDCFLSDREGPDIEFRNWSG